MIVVTGHSNGGDGICFVSQADTAQEAFEEMRSKIGGKLTTAISDDDEVDVLLEPNRELKEDGSIPNHGAWTLYANPVNDDGFAEATW